MWMAWVCCATSELGAQGTITQYGRKAVSKGPRALGLIYLTPKGKARIVPVAIMVDGKFFDAAAYKGTPVPMALDFGVVYEGFRTGESLGLFTITQPGQLNHNWMAEGTWLAAGAKPPETSKKYEAPKIEGDSGPPKLHRPGEKPAAPEQKPAETTPGASAPPPAKPPGPSVAKPAPEPQAIDDPNRPILRRGKPDPTVRHEPMKTFKEDEFEMPGQAGKQGAPKDAKIAEVQIIPAISDAGGPDARPYRFDTTPKEEASYRAKMIELAGAELQATKKDVQAATAKERGRTSVAMPKPSFENVQVRIFDLSNANEPVLVLSAETDEGRSTGTRKEIALIARTNLEGELRKLFFSQTDSQHRDETPRMELIDAVDADGDGRGELLFRRTFDSGAVYAIYRVTADRIWPLYEPQP